MEIILGLVALGVVVLALKMFGMTRQNRRERLRERDEFVGVIDVRRNNKERLRTDDEYRDRVRDKFNN